VLIGIVSDIHCNAPALKRAIDLMGAVDELVCLGDSIREYQFSNEVVSLLRSRAAIVIQGNHEEVFFGRLGEKSRCAGGVDPELLGWLESQPSTRTLHLCGREILLVHSTPWQPRGRYVCGDDRDFGRFGEVSADAVLYGHTHEPLIKQAGRVLVVNPGSTGEPKMRNDRLEMSCAVLDVPLMRARIIQFAE
jgi:putative phosphoesterase